MAAKKDKNRVHLLFSGASEYNSVS
jgi:hypothetical protein